MSKKDYVPPETTRQALQNFLSAMAEMSTGDAVWTKRRLALMLGFSPNTSSTRKTEGGGQKVASKISKLKKGAGQKAQVPPWKKELQSSDAAARYKELKNQVRKSKKTEEVIPQPLIGQLMKAKEVYFTLMKELRPKAEAAHEAENESPAAAGT